MVEVNTTKEENLLALAARAAARNHIKNKSKQQYIHS